MAVTAFWYHNAIGRAFNKEYDVVGGTDDCYCGLTSSSYTPSQSTHDYYDDITNELSTAGGYTSGGQQLTSDDFTLNTGVWKWDSTDPSWTSASFTARYAFYYVNTAGASSADPLIVYVDFGADQTVSSGTFTIVQHANGISTITVS